MDNFTFCAPCIFGLEGIAADELRRMDLQDVRAENGRVFFSGGQEALARANLCLATGERVLLLVGQFPAGTFEELFQGTRALPWEAFIPRDARFPVKGSNISSKLFSMSDCQSIIKKAVVERLKTKYHLDWFPETGEKVQIQFSLLNDVAYLFLDATGPGLHKRGYRAVGNAAPLKETLAAGMVRIARYRGRESVRDPFCGSGTLPIEAALAARNRAPGLNRTFACQDWRWVKGDVFRAERDRARDLEFHGQYDIWGGDIDPRCVEIARSNARKAGVEGDIRFETADARQYAMAGTVLSNPPYGERIMEKRDAEALYRDFGKALFRLPDWRAYLLSSHTEFERTFGKKAVKKRKLYNGMIKCDLFMYY